MIVNQNTNPTREIYYLGALAIEILSKKNGEVNLFDLYQYLNEEEEISMHLFLFILDWLYLIDAIQQKNGVIRLCS